MEARNRMYCAFVDNIREGLLRRDGLIESYGAEEPKGPTRYKSKSLLTAVACPEAIRVGRGVGHDETPALGSAPSPLAYRPSAGKWPLERLTH